MAVIQEKMVNGTVPADCSIEDEILALSDTLYQQDEIAYAHVVARLAERLSPQVKRDLSRTLRSPLNAFGIFKDDLEWMEVEKATEQSRAEEAEDHLGLNAEQWAIFQKLTHGFGEQDENGVDLSHLRANLRLTPTQRLEKHQQALARMKEMRRAGIAAGLYRSAESVERA